MRKTKSLMRKTLTRFAVCVAALLLLATPLFYWLTKSFYAEDMIDLIEAVERGRPIPAPDLESDIMAGVMIQFCLIAAVLGIAIVVTMQVVSRRLWTPFDKILEEIEDFSLERGRVPTLDDGGTEEFARLNRSLTSLMEGCIDSYRQQKEFTENASHELQTPLAVFRSKLDLLMQQPGITERQAGAIRELGQTVSRLSRLNRNLLLLAKMENHQYETGETVDIVALAKGLLPSLEAVACGTRITLRAETEALPTRANRPLTEIMVSNLVVNAIRHNAPDGDILIRITSRRLSISNTATGEALDETKIFQRFYRPASQSASLSTPQTQGNGLGLAIVKSVCDYHGWRVSYAFETNRHVFSVDFP